MLLTVLDILNFFCMLLVSFITCYEEKGCMIVLPHGLLRFFLVYFRTSGSISLHDYLDFSRFRKFHFSLFFSISDAWVDILIKNYYCK
jgi:hypothetical protein